MSSTALLLLFAVTHRPCPVSFADLGRFPGLVETEAACQWLLARREWCEQQAQIGPREDVRRWWWEARAEAHEAWYSWDCLRVAQRESGATYYRLRWLEELRRRLAPQAWSEGRMPDLLP